ncbi:MAG: DUF6110 family protein [Lachnospiraceae bacterium]|nr:DUF6110 family protein [Lachnospiraceae bacterium]
MLMKKAGAGLFAAGVLFGTAGIKILTSKDARKLYTHCTAAVLRAKECILDTATAVQEGAADIYAEAQIINEERAEEEAVFGDDFDFDIDGRFTMEDDEDEEDDDEDGEDDEDDEDDDEESSSKK